MADRQPSKSNVDVCKAPQGTGENGIRRKKKVRRSKKGKKQYETLKLMYSNIQGVTKKKESLLYIMEELECDICLLAETMTKNVELSGCRCINPIKSIGQNVCIILRNKLLNNEIIKLYEPNEVVNLMGIRVELMNSCLRLYTAHLKQQSACPREDILAQFEEIRRQFQDATKSNEGMLHGF